MVEPDEEASLPPKIFGPAPEQRWRYLDASPNHASERVIFIQGYAFSGQWGKMAELILETIKINKFMEPMLCLIWDDISINTKPSDEWENAIQLLRRA